MKRLFPIETAAPILNASILLVACIGTVALLMTPYPMLAFGPGLAILGLLVFGRKPSWIYLLVVALIPFWGIRNIGGINVQWPLSALLLFILAIHYLPKKRFPPSLRSEFWPLFIGLFLLFILSTLVSDYPETAWEHVSLLAYAFMFVAVGFIFIDKNLYRAALPKVILWTVTLGSIVSVLDHVLNIPFIPIGEKGFGLTNHPNNAAQMAIFALPLGVHEFVYRRHIQNRGLILLLILINIAGVIVTFSRVGFLVLVLTALVLSHEFWHKLRARYTGLIIATLMIGLTIAVFTVPSSYWERQTSLIEWQDSSLKRRTAYILIGWESFLEHPLLGAGPGTFQDIYPQSQHAAEFWTEKESHMRRHAHNGYLELLVGTGIFGLILFLAILAMAFYKFTRSKHRFLSSGDAELASLTGCYRASFISIVLYLTTGSIIYHKQLLLVLAISHAAWLISLGSDEIQHEDSRII